MLVLADGLINVVMIVQIGQIFFQFHDFLVQRLLLWLELIFESIHFLDLLFGLLLALHACDIKLELQLMLLIPQLLILVLHILQSHWLYINAYLLNWWFRCCICFCIKLARSPIRLSYCPKICTISRTQTFLVRVIRWLSPAVQSQFWDYMKRVVLFGIILSLLYKIHDNKFISYIYLRPTPTNTSTT